MREAPSEQIAIALFNRAYSKSELNDADGAREDYQAALEQPGLEKNMREEIRHRLASLPKKSASA